MKYTATLSAQNTSVYICDVVRPNQSNDWFANAMATGTFGGGTVSFQLSPDSGTTKYTMTQDGSATVATLTAAGCQNLRAGDTGTNTNLQLYAAIGAATTPSVTITVADNRG